MWYVYSLRDVDTDPTKKLGPYVLVDPIGRGGMAEVHRARRDGPGGFVKDLALKKILKQYAKNKGLVQRFMEEARVAGALIHGNVVQVYDFGQVSNEYYLVMEYIDGMSLAVLLDRCAAMDVPLPSPLVAYIGAETCSGLAYAHELTDSQGRKVDVVHRDVSPQNIMISFAGDVKIGDFGIAKAADSLIRTEVGLRLGKASYMSPEQASGEPLDARSDLFALGVTLWEALTLKPLLPRGDAVKTIEVLAKCDFPRPSELRADVPPALEEIVMRSLAHDRDARYEDGEEMARALRAFVHLASPGFGRPDLVEYLEWIRPGESRPSGLGPPMPPPAPPSMSRTTGKQEAKKPLLWPWIVLAASPVIGILLGAATFLGFYIFVPSDEPAAQEVVAPPATSEPGLPPQPPLNGVVGPAWNTGAPAPPPSSAVILPPATSTSNVPGAVPQLPAQLPLGQEAAPDDSPPVAATEPEEYENTPRRRNRRDRLRRERERRAARPRRAPAEDPSREGKPERSVAGHDDEAAAW